MPPARPRYLTLWLLWPLILYPYAFALPSEPVASSIQSSLQETFQIRQHCGATASYLEGSAGTWLMYSRDRGLHFDNRFLTRQLALVSSAAIATAIAGRIPVIVGYDSSVLNTLARAQALFLPGYYLWQVWQQLQRDDSHSSHQIIVADNRALAERLTIEIQKANSVQRLIFKMPPVSLTGLPADGLKATIPLARLAWIMTVMHSDYMEISWSGHRTSAQLSVGRGGGRLAIIEVPEWGRALTNISKNQKLPSVIAFLQPAGIQSINSVLDCLQKGQYGKNSCAIGTLLPEADGFRISHYRFQPNTDLSNLKSLTGKMLGHRYLMPLPPCQAKHQCAMAMAWSMETSSGQYIASHLPDSSTPLMLYTRPKALLEIPKRLSAPAHPMMATVQQWQTDLLALLPYTAVYLLADKLLGRGIRSLSFASASMTGGGAGLFGIFGAGMSGNLSDDGGYPYSSPREDGMGGGGFGDGYSSDNPFQQLRRSPLKYSRMAYAPQWAALETEMVHAVEELGGATPQSGLYQLEETSEPTLTHYGNNCFFNSTLAYLSNTLSEKELRAIEKNRFLPAGIMETMDTLQLQNYTELRDSFVTLIRALKPAAAMQTSIPARNVMQQRLFQAVQGYAAICAEKYRFAADLLAGHSMRHLKQQDAGEFLIALTDALGLPNNPAASFIVGSQKEFHVNGEVGRWPNINANEHFNIVPIGLPGGQDIKENRITSFDQLLNQHLLKKEWIDENNAFNVTPADAKAMGLTDPDLLQYGAPLPFYRELVLTHANASKLQHLDIQAKIYNHAHNIKICRFTRRLLEGGGTLNIPVYNTSMKRHTTVRMEPDTMIMHSGNTLYGGHYVTAIRRGGDWYIYDDIASNLVKLQSTSRLWGPSSVQMINSYMEDYGLDPYIIHYRR